MKEGILKYVRIIGKLYIAFTVVVFAVIMVCLVYAFNQIYAFYIITPALIVLWLVVYALYALRVSLGTVVGIEVTDEVVHLKTKRKTYTYDRERGCENVRIKGNKFVATFANEKSRDSFILYRRVLFSKYQDEQFTVEDVASFYPQIETVDVRKK